MKAFQKLALVSAIALTTSAFAMEAADDETLAATTGQDGITIKIAPGTLSAATLTALGVSGATQTAIDVAGINAAGALTGPDSTFKGLVINQIVMHDDDGLDVAGLSRSGAMVIGDGTTLSDRTVLFADNTTPIQVDIDMVGDNNTADAVNTPMLQVGIKTPTLVLKTGNIYVASSNASDDETVSGLDHNGDGDTGDASVNGSTHADRVKIMNGLSVTIGGSGASNLMTIQLGNEAQTLFGGAAGALNPEVMIRLAATMTGGLTISNLELIDQDSAAGVGGGSILASSMSIVNADASGNLDVLAGVNVGDGSSLINPAGLVITLGGLGGKGADTVFGTADDVGANITLNDVRLGTAATEDLGDTQILGLNLAGTSLIISGH